MLLLAEDPSDDEGPERVLAHAKCNVAPRAPSLACRVDTAKVHSDGRSIETSRLVVLGEHKLSARALLEAAGEQGEEGSALTEAIAFLRAELAEGPVATNDLLGRARKAAVSERTLRRAKERIGVEARQGVLPGNARGWAWRLAEDACD